MGTFATATRPNWAFDVASSGADANSASRPDPSSAAPRLPTDSQLRTVETAWRASRAPNLRAKTGRIIWTKCSALGTYVIGALAGAAVLLAHILAAVMLRRRLVPTLSAAVARLIEVVVALTTMLTTVQLLGAMQLFTPVPVVLVELCVGASIAMLAHERPGAIRPSTEIGLPQGPQGSNRGMAPRSWCDCGRGAARGPATCSMRWVEG